MSERFRTGGHWPVTVIEIGAGPEDREGRHVGDRLMACAQTPEDAERIVAALNATEST